MSVIERQIVAVYNQRAGNGQAEKILQKQLSQARNELSPVIIKEIDQLSNSNLLKLTEKARQILLAIYAGDGTQAHLLTQVFRLIENRELDHKQICLCLVGNKGSGGERVLARTLRTNNKTLAQIIKQHDQDPQRSEINLKPNFIENAGNLTQPIWWLYGSASGIMAQSLAHIESLRKTTGSRHLQRMIITAYQIIKTFQYDHKLQATINQETFAGQELAYLVPPFMALSRIKFATSLEPMLLTMNKDDLTQAEFNRQAMLALLSLSVLGFSHSSVVKTRHLLPQEKLTVYNSQEPQIIDSERIVLGSPVTIFQNPTAPSVKAVRLK